MRWLFFYFFLTISAVFQSLFLDSEWSPLLFWPPLFYFFLFQGFFSALLVLFFVSLLSSALLALPAPDLFFIYLFGFISLKMITFFFSYKAPHFFFLWTFLFSCLFYGLIERLDFVSPAFLWTPFFFTLIKAFTTALTALLCFSFLKKAFPIVEGD